MNTRITFPLVAACATLLLSAALTAGQARAEEAEKANPLQFYTGENGSYAKVTLEADLGFFTQGNSWFGNSADPDNLGRKSDHWWESLIRPGLDVNYVLPSTQTLYGQFDVVQANTFGGIDAYNSTDGDAHSLRVDHAFMGWKSGNLFSGLDENFLDISFGRQRYTLGNGFLFASQGSASGGRAAYWIGGRNSADYAGVIRMKSGNWSSDLIYFEPDQVTDVDTRLGGGNVEYTVEKMGNLGAGFYMMESDDTNRDSMNIYNLRAGIFPFAVAGGADALKPLHIEGEYAHEDMNTGMENGNAWYAQVSYQAENCPWTPTLTYRYASFDDNYDSLFFGSTDWETWYQGEILGEYYLDNYNLDSHMLKLKMQPIEPVAVTLAYIDFNRHDSDADLAKEYNLIVDWTVNDHLALSLVGGIATPDEAAEIETGGDDNWSYMMMFGSIKF